LIEFGEDFGDWDSAGQKLSEAFRAGKEDVRPNPPITHCDDDNDTLLFEMLQEYVLTHYPNPERIGCLDAKTLEAFVYTPETLELSDCKFLHIFKCAECTRALMNHRKEKARRANHRESVGTKTRKPRHAYVRLVSAILLSIGCLVIG
jgi:hypothetical protein